MQLAFWPWVLPLFVAVPPDEGTAYVSYGTDEMYDMPSNEWFDETSVDKYFHETQASDLGCIYPQGLGQAFVSGYTEDVPDEIRAQLRAKAEEIAPGDITRQKRLVEKASEQYISFRNLQNLNAEAITKTARMSPDSLDVVRQQAEERCPGNYRGQEGYIADQISSQIELEMGDDSSYTPVPSGN